MKRKIKTYEPYFDPAEHLYHTPSGMRLEATTDIISGELGLYRGMDPSYAVRGTQVHSAIQYYNEGDLDEATLHHVIADYLECFKAAQKHHGIKVLQSEVRRYHPKYLYAGTCDAIVEIGGRVGILDYKTGPFSKEQRWQLAAYFELMKREVPGLEARWTLHLKPKEYDGVGFKLVEHSGKRDFQEFLALFAAYQLKKNEGYIREKRRI